MQERIPFGLRVIQFVGGICLLAHLYILLTASISPIWGIVGGFGYLLAYSLFWRAIRVNRSSPLTHAFTPDAPRHLVRGGPYRFIRHPFYAAYSLGWMAGVVGTQSLALLPTLGMLVIYYLAARAEEQKFMASPFREQYLEYQRSTGMFLPVRLLGRFMYTRTRAG
jgi:protein-S-isoprenylcysteine O-methyltransferase Ste14